MAILSAFFAAFWTSSAVPSMPSTTALPRNIAARPTMDTASKLVAATNCSTVALDGVPPDWAGAAPAAGARGTRAAPGDMDVGSDVNVLTTSPMAEKALETPHSSSQCCVRDGHGKSGESDLATGAFRRGRSGRRARGLGDGAPSCPWSSGARDVARCAWEEWLFRSERTGRGNGQTPRRARRAARRGRSREGSERETAMAFRDRHRGRIRCEGGAARGWAATAPPRVSSRVPASGRGVAASGSDPPRRRGVALSRRGTSRAFGVGGSRWSGKKPPRGATKIGVSASVGAVNSRGVGAPYRGRRGGGVIARVRGDGTCVVSMIGRKR